MSKPHKPSSYDPHLSDIYAQMSQEQPDVTLDETIMAQAKRKISSVNKKPTHDRKSTWRRYQWPFSIAASAVFVTFIVFTQFNGFDPKVNQPQSLPANPLQIAEQAMLDTHQGRTREKLEKKARTTGQVASPQESALPEQNEVLAELTIAEPELSNFAEQEAQTLAARALDDIEIEQLSIVADAEIELDTSLPLQGIDEQVAQQYAARQAQSNSLAAQDEQRLAEENVTTDTIVISGSRTKNSFSVNTEYLDNLLLNYVTIAGDKKTADDSRLQTLDASQQEIRQNILSYLTLLKAAQPNVVIDDKYLNILDEEQRQTLFEND